MSSKDYYSSSAPEVTPSSIPEHAYQDHERPEAVQYHGQYGSTMAYYGPQAVVEEKLHPRKASKKILIISIMGAFAALAIGIGIGVGIGISVEKNSNSSGSSQEVQNGYAPTSGFTCMSR